VRIADCLERGHDRLCDAFRGHEWFIGSCQHGSVPIGPAVWARDIACLRDALATRADHGVKRPQLFLLIHGHTRWSAKAREHCSHLLQAALVVEAQRRDRFNCFVNGCV